LDKSKGQLEEARKS